MFIFSGNLKFAQQLVDVTVSDGLQLIVIMFSVSICKLYFSLFLEITHQFFFFSILKTQQ